MIEAFGLVVLIVLMIKGIINSANEEQYKEVLYYVGISSHSRINILIGDLCNGNL